MMQLKAMKNTQIDLLNNISIKDSIIANLQKDKSPKIKNREKINTYLNNYALFFNNSTKELSVNKNTDFRERVFEEFKVKYDKFRIFHNINFDDIEFYSFLNFLRYYAYLFKYFENFLFYKTFSKKEVSIVFRSNQKTFISLQLTFQTNGITRFLSQDQDGNDLEKQTYMIEGKFSSSNLMSRNYKIERLMQILTSESKQHYSEFHNIFFVMEHNEIVQETCETVKL